MVAQPMQRRLPGSASAVPQSFTEEGAGSQFRCSGVCPEGEVGGLSATSLRSLGDLSAIALCPEVKSAVFGDAPAASSALLARRGSTPQTACCSGVQPAASRSSTSAPHDKSSSQQAGC
mmetsp:Transcript_4539/g.15195  ORF Transcript_4539/g.15195 Transcript_4539/m.15195 type:complete len:119 (-) Transcript_4539:386-742(-)